MIAFKQMWEDVNKLVTENKVGFDINLRVKNVFVVNDDNDAVFLTKEDFVSFWCKLYSSSCIERDMLKNISSKKEVYIYDLFRFLPYIKECDGAIALIN